MLAPAGALANGAPAQHTLRRSVGCISVLSAMLMPVLHGVWLAEQAQAPEPASAKHSLTHECCVRCITYHLQMPLACHHNLCQGDDASKLSGTTHNVEQLPREACGCGGCRLHVPTDPAPEASISFDPRYEANEDPPSAGGKLPCAAAAAVSWSADRQDSSRRRRTALLWWPHQPTHLLDDQLSGIADIVQRHLLPRRASAGVLRRRQNHQPAAVEVTTQGTRIASSTATSADQSLSTPSEARKR